jgi:hypothetical protein
VFEELAIEERPFSRRWFADPAPFLVARWLWLRALGLIFASAFHSLWFQIHGLIGTGGILPARDYLPYAREVAGLKAFWLVPTLFWISASNAMLTAVVVIGLLASAALVLNLWPRLAIGVAAVCFLSFVAAAQVFSSYQSDGMQLFARNPFPGAPPRAVRAVLWRYRFTTPAERARTGAWWHRELAGEYR